MFKIITFTEIPLGDNYSNSLYILSASGGITFVTLEFVIKPYKALIHVKTLGYQLN